MRVLTRILPPWFTIDSSNWDFQTAVYSEFCLKIYICMSTKFNWLNIWRRSRQRRTLIERIDLTWRFFKEIIFFWLIWFKYNLRIQESFFNIPCIHHESLFGMHFQLTGWLAGLLREYGGQCSHPQRSLLPWDDKQLLLAPHCWNGFCRQMVSTGRCHLPHLERKIRRESYFALRYYVSTTSCDLAPIDFFLWSFLKKKCLSLTKGWFERWE